MGGSVTIVVIIPPEMPQGRHPDRRPHNGRSGGIYFVTLLLGHFVTIKAGHPERRAKGP